MTDLINHKTVITSLHSYVYDPERSDQVRLKTCMHGVPTATVLIHSSSKSSKRYTSVHPFFYCLSRAGSQGQQPKQRSPLLPSPATSSISPGRPRERRAQNTSPRRHPNQMPRPPQQPAAFNMCYILFSKIKSNHLKTKTKNNYYFTTDKQFQT